MTTLKAGDMAPQFTAVNQDGNTVSLSDFKGHKVILYFYPKDNTSGCTLEAQSLRDGKAELVAMGFEIVGVSRDSVKSHCGFISKNSLNFMLLSDPDVKVATAYGVWGEKTMYGKKVMGIARTTFVIDAEGVIERVFTKVDTANHWKQIADSYKQTK